MIISKTPYRISFFGGGTDYPSWYEKNSGAVISTTINKYSYILLRQQPDIFDYKYIIRYFKREERSKLHDIEHPVVREVFKLFKFKKGMTLIHHGDLPARTGIASSSAFTVGLINAASRLQNFKINSRTLAKKAIYVEQNLLKENVGSQDQVALSYGGLNRINFNKREIFNCKKLKYRKENYQLLEDSIMLVFTKAIRNSDKIAKKIIKKIENNYNLNDMLQITNEAEKIFLNKNSNSFIDDFSYFMREQWRIKKHLSKYVSNNDIDNIYNKAIKLGAKSGKIIGAGGGGFLLFIVPPHKHKYLTNKLGYSCLDIKFSKEGSKILHQD